MWDMYLFFKKNLHLMNFLPQSRFLRQSGRTALTPAYLSGCQSLRFAGKGRPFPGRYRLYASRLSGRTAEREWRLLERPLCWFSYFASLGEKRLKKLYNITKARVPKIPILFLCASSKRTHNRRSSC